MEMTVADVAAVTGGTVAGSDVTVTSFTQDSRTVRPGALFVPLVADRDGHDFIADAVERGAVAYLTSRPDAGSGGASGEAGDTAEGGSPVAIVVEDTQAALEALGAAARDRLSCPVIGITGSVGKTSAKDLTAAVLGADRRVHAADRSHNNEIGVPLTLLDAPTDTEAVVVEMGARGIGHIAHLCGIARPTVGVVTRVAAAHTSLIGGLRQVARAKAELIDALPSTGIAVLNADDPLVADMVSVSRAAVVTYGLGHADVTARDVVLDGELRPTFVLLHRHDEAEVRLAARGAHMVSNALAAAAVGIALGVDLATVADGLATAALSPHRMDVLRTQSGAVVIDDAYNANPASMDAALDALLAVPAQRRVAVVGVMAELGDAEHGPAHRAVAERATAEGVELVVVGEEAYGPTPLGDADAAVAAVGELGPDVAVLVKASRVAGLERVVEALVHPPD